MSRRGPCSVRSRWRAAAILLAAFVAGFGPTPGFAETASHPPTGGAPPGKPLRNIGVLFDGGGVPGVEILGLLGRDEVLALLRDEIGALTSDDFDVRFPEELLITADWSPEGIDAGMERLLQDERVDLVLTLGLYSTQAACRRRDLPKPVIAPFVIDRGLQELPEVGNRSGVKNLNFLNLAHSIVDDLRRFHELAPHRRVHVVHDALTTSFFPDIYDFVRGGVADLGVEAIPVPVKSRAREALDELDANAEAVYLTPLPRLSPDEFGLLIEGINARRLPSFSVVGRADVERGVMAARYSDVSVTRLMRRIALNAQRIFLGEDAAELPVDLAGPERLLVNMETARRIGWSPPWRVLAEAELVHPAPEARGGQVLSLGEAVREAVARNLELRAVDRSVAAGEEEIRRARALLRPQLDAGLTGLRIDADRAAASLGSQTERTVSGDASFSQVLYSDAAWGNVRIQRRLQESRVSDRERIRLDVALESARAFLEVLRAETLEKVQRNNLRLTMSHLETARRRQELGVSGPAEVYRWESNLAADRREVVTASRQVDSARAVLNRLLNRPQKDLFSAGEPSLDDPGLITGHGRLAPYVGDPLSFEIFAEFAVRQGLERAWELRSIDAAIAARERDLLTARRAFWSPTVTLFAGVEHDLSRGGAGAEGPALPPPLSLPGPDDTDWSIGVGLRLPLSTGGERMAALRRAQEELARLRLERAAAAESVELRVRTSLYAVAASFPAIEFNRDSAAAAAKNLELVSDMYSRGAVSILDLLDAQNATLVADQLASNAVYDFLIDLMGLQRAMSNFDFFRTSAERDAWFEELDRFFRQAGGPGPPPGG